MTNIIIGNIISSIAAILLVCSCWTKNSKKVFLYQTLENLILAISSIVFGSYSAAVSTILSSVRSYLVLNDKYTKQTMIVFCFVLTALGLLLNTKGIIGILPVLGSLEFTYANYRFTDIKGIKWSLVVNLIIWDIYAFLIMDYSSGITWAITLIVTLVSLVQIYKKEMQEKRINSSNPC